MSIVALIGFAVPAHAAVLAGVCTVKVTVNYGTIGVVPAATTIDFSSNPLDSMCAQPEVGDPLTTVNLDGTGGNVSVVPTVKSCELTVAEGSYTALFGSDAVFEDSAGTFVFTGNLAAATIVLTDMTPTFAGVVDLVLDPLTYGNAGQVAMCAGVDPVSLSLVYTGTLAFVEETTDFAL